MICGYIASTLDGYIAGPDHSFSFLDPYPAEDAGYEDFYAGIGTLVMGRNTYEVCRRSMPAWPYAGKRLIVVTSHQIADLPADAEIWTKGVDALIEHLRASAKQDVWIVGGGIPLYPAAARSRTLKLAEVGRFGEIAHLRLERQ